MDDAPTAERRIAGDGTAEEAWQAWFGSASLRSIECDDLLRAGQRLVVLAPHPDDEVLACGALLQRHVARGGAALVVAATDGEASHADDARVRPADLARQRHRERLDGLARLGLPQVPVQRLGLGDGRVAAHAEQLAQLLVGLLRADDVLLTTWRLDGHPDHEACGHAAQRAAEQAGCRLVEAPVWMWHWASPGDARVPWRRLRRFAVEAEEQGRKVHALDAHLTQFEPRRGPAAEAPDVADATEATEATDDAATANTADTADTAAHRSLPPVLGPAIVERNARAAEHYFV